MWARLNLRLLGAMLVAAVVVHCAVVQPVPSSGSEVSVYGASIFYSPETQRPMDAVTLGRAFVAAAEYWGTSPEAMKGWVVIQRGTDAWEIGPVWVWGISYMDIKRMDFATPRPDCPAAVFVHEWGHAGAGILGHDDPRFEPAPIQTFLVGKGICSE